MLLPALVELVGTFIFLSVIIGTGQAVAIAATLFAVIMWGGSISGGNFNPAISAMFFVKGDISAQKFIIYVVAQVSGGVAALYWWQATKKIKA